MNESNPDWHRMNDCDRVEAILRDRLLLDSDNLLLSYLWREKRHISGCSTCRKKFPNGPGDFAALVSQAENLLALELDRIRGEYLNEAAQIALDAIRFDPAVCEFPMDYILLGSRDSVGLESNAKCTERTLTNLCRSGKRVKELFSAIHGDGLVWFNVVADSNNDEQAHARAECAGLVRCLSREAREFAFGAMLAAELAPDLTWDPASQAPRGIHLGTLLKALQTAARGYAEEYMSSPEMHTAPEPELPSIATTVITGSQEDRIEALYDAQTAIMDVQSGLMQRMQAFEQEREIETGNSDKAVEAGCKRVLQQTLGSRFDDLTLESQADLIAAERLYLEARNDSEYALCVVSFTRAFEREFRRRVVEPLAIDLERIALEDSTLKGDFSTYTLGQHQRLLDKHCLKCGVLLRRIGLEFDHVCRAISVVNREKGAKHVDAISAARAQRFRKDFLGSALNSLFPAS